MWFTVLLRIKLILEGARRGAGGGGVVVSGTMGVEPYLFIKDAARGALSIQAAVLHM